jgi:hypothetical protein
MMKNFVLVAVLALNAQICHAQERQSDRRFPSCEIVTKMAEVIMTRRVMGASFTDQMESLESIDARGSRWVMQLMVYDAYYNEVDLLDGAAPDDHAKRQLAIASFKLLWEMDCMGLDAWKQMKDEARRDSE